MSKKALATFTLAVAGAGFMPGASLAHAADAPKANTWALPSPAAVDAQDGKKAPRGADFAITVETRESVKDAWKDATKSQPVSASETREQRDDALLQAQKLVGSPEAVKATKEEDALLRVTYRESATPVNYWGNDDAITLYEVADGWVQATSHGDADRQGSDQVKFTKAQGGDSAKVQFSNEPFVAPAPVVAPTATPSKSASAAPASSVASTSTESAATQAPSTSAPVASTTASATSSATEQAPVASVSSAATPTASSPAPTQATQSVAAQSPLALPKTGMLAAASAYTIDGTVFTDSNKNGAFDSTEKAAANRTVVLKNELDQSVVAMRTTDASGHYSFGSLQKGTYNLSVSPSGGSNTTSVWGNTTTDHAVVIINDTMNSSTVDFGVSGGTVKDKHELENGTASPSASASPSSTATSTPSSSSSSSATSEAPETSTATGTEVVPAPSGSSSDGSQTVVNSGDVPNSVNGAALAAGVGFLGGAGVLARLGLRRKR